MRPSSFICERFSASASTAVLYFSVVPAVTSSGGSSPITCRLPSSERCFPQQCTSTSISLASSRLRYSTCTPAPPYTSGGYSRVINPTRIVHPQLLRNSIREKQRRGAINPRRIGAGHLTRLVRRRMLRMVNHDHVHHRLYRVNPQP